MIRRLTLFLLVTGLAVAAAVWLADRPGTVTIHWQGWRLDTSVPVLVLAMVAAVAVLQISTSLVRGVLAAPRRFLTARRAKRTAQGYRALSDGLAAIAVGDAGRAKSLARRADKLLPDQSLTGLLNAQAAQLAGDEAEAGRRLTQMLARPETAFLGLKGLLSSSLGKGEYGVALDYARRAWAMNGPSDGLAQTLFDLQARAGQWGEAEITLTEARRRGAMNAADLRRAQAVTLVERARQNAASGDVSAALDMALNAHRMEPLLAPAAVLAADLLHRRGKDRKAASILTAAWKAAPHPDLIESFLALAPAEVPLQRVNRLEKLVKANSAAPDGHLALAQAALAAKLWGHARTHLLRALEQRPSAKIYSLLARLERDERKDEAAAHAWLDKGRNAPADPAWVCGPCGHAASQWSVTCPACGAVDSLAWRSAVVASPLSP